MMRLIIGAIIIFGLFAPTVQAQVAVPRIVPSSVLIGDPTTTIPSASFVTANPATIQWGAPTRWGVGQIKADWLQTNPTTDSIGDPNIVKEISGLYAGGRSITKDYTFAGELVELADDPKEFPLFAQWNVLRAGVAFLSGDIISFGVGMDRASIIQGSSSIDFDTTLLGLSFQVNQKYYLGLAMGTENVNQTSIGESERAVQKYGLAYRQGGSGGQWHAEYFVVTKSEAKEEQYISYPAFSGEKTTGVVLETILGSIMAGASASITKQDYSDSYTNKIDTRNTLAIDVGWAPKKGLSILYHLEKSTREFETEGYNIITNLNEPIIYEYESNSSVITIAYIY